MKTGRVTSKWRPVCVCAIYAGVEHEEEWRGGFFNLQLNLTDLKSELKMLLKEYTNFVQKYSDSQMEGGLQDNPKLYIFLINLNNHMDSARSACLFQLQYLSF